MAFSMTDSRHDGGDTTTLLAQQHTYGTMEGNEEWHAEVDHPYSYVMVFPNPTADEYASDAESLRNARLEIIRKLHSVGFRLKRFKSRDKDELFLLIGASPELLETTAEELEIDVPLKPEKEGGAPAGFAPYIRKSRHLFLNTSKDPNVFQFKSKDKMRIIHYKIGLQQELGGCGIDVEKRVKQGELLHFFPLHTEEVDRLSEIWASNYRAGLDQPLDAIRNYFGEKIALYFAFLSFYTRWLIAPALFGTCLTVGQLVYMKYDVPWIVCAMAIFTSIWSIMFLEFWGRWNKQLAWKWNCVGFEEEEIQRPSFKGTLQKDPVTDKQKLWYDPMLRLGHQTMSYGVIFLIVSSVVVCMTTVLFLKQSDGDISFWAGILNGLMIAGFNEVYKSIAVRLNDWENYETDTDYEDNLISKIFIFQFINSYFTLYLVAFVKPWSHHSDFIKDVLGECKCVDDDDDGTSTDMDLTLPFTPNSTDDDECEERSCVGEIATLLVTIFLVQLLIGNVQEFGLPWIKGIIRERWEIKSMETKGLAVKDLNKPEAESKKEPYSSTFDDYNEMAIQFGYITLFAAAFPMVSLFALMNNVIEIRSDASKLCHAHQRPSAKQAEDIGTWLSVMQLMSMLAVTTNCAFAWFSSKLYDESVDHWGVQAAVWGFVFSEHALFLLKMAIAWVIPDVPEEVEVAMKRARYLEKLRLREMSGYSTTTPPLPNQADLERVAEDDLYPSDMENEPITNQV